MQSSPVALVASLDFMLETKSVRFMSGILNLMFAGTSLFTWLSSNIKSGFAVGDALSALGLSLIVEKKKNKIYCDILSVI